MLDRNRLSYLINKYGTNYIISEINFINENLDNNHTINISNSYYITKDDQATIDLDIEAVKRYLMKLTKTSSWNECVENQKFGQCKKIAKKIFNSKFGKMFDYILEVCLKYDEDACDLCVESGDEIFKDKNERVGNHFVLVRDNKIYDFAKGANSLYNVYLLVDPNKQSTHKYDVTWDRIEYDKITQAYFRSVI